VIAAAAGDQRPVLIVEEEDLLQLCLRRRVRVGLSVR
jgi:hypothetical protein